MRPSKFRLGYKVKKITITLSKFFNNLMCFNCKIISNWLIIKNCKFFECIINSTFTQCDYRLNFGARALPHIGDNICTLLSRIYNPEICVTVAPNLQCSRHTVGGATSAPKFFIASFGFVIYLTGPRSSSTFEFE